MGSGAVADVAGYTAMFGLQTAIALASLAYVSLALKKETTHD